MLVLLNPDVDKRVQIVYEATLRIVVTPRSDKVENTSYINKGPQ